MKIIPIVEMQTRLSEMLSPSTTEIIQVTHQGSPVAAVLPLRPYQAFREQIAAHQIDAPVNINASRTSLTETQHLFHSYRNRLALRLQGSDGMIHIIEIMRRKRLVGAVVAWEDWHALAGDSPQEHETPEQRDQTLTIVAARNRLLKLVEQFANEEQRGTLTPITVTRQGTAVMAIVSWGWFQRVTDALKRRPAPFLKMRSDGSLMISSNQEPSEGSNREILSDQFDEISSLGSRFQHAASIIAEQTSSLIDANVFLTDSFDQACRVLEVQCTMAQRLAQELLALVQILPLHTAILKQYRSLPEGVDPQAIWEVGELARMTYEHALRRGRSKKRAWETTRRACLAWALQRSWSQGQPHLSSEVETLVEQILIAVKELVERRR